MKKRSVDRLPHGIALDLCEHIQRAILTGNGYFFSDLARICEYEKTKPEDSLEYWLTIIHWNCLKGWKTEGQQYNFTVPELCELAFMRGFKHHDNDEAGLVKIPARKMREICKRLGIKTLNARKPERQKSDFKTLFERIKSAKPITIEHLTAITKRRK